MKKILYLILLFIQLIIAQPNNYQFSQLKVEDGLSQTTILSILQDKKGYMWFGTGNGLNKYDGYNFTVFSNNPNDSTSISNNSISSLYEDKDGFIWIGTIDGILNKYDRVNDIFYRYNILEEVENTSTSEEYYEYPIAFSRNNSNSITSIDEDKNGNLWIGTWGRGLIIFNKFSERVNHYHNKPDSPNNLSSNRIPKILIDSEDIAWIGTLGGGLNRVTNIKDINNLSFEVIKTSKGGLSDNNIISLFEDNSRNLWIGTYLGGLNYLRADRKKLDSSSIQIKVFKNIPGKNSLANNSVMSIIQDRNKNLWIATFGGGLDRYNIKTNEFFNFKNKQLDENSIADNDVLSLCEDKSGIIWIGTNLGAGVSKLERNKIKFKTLKSIPNEKNSLSDDVVWAIHQDNQKNIWVGTYRGGLNKYNPHNGKFSVYKNNSSKNSISDNHIRSIAEDNYGNLWVGTYSNGLNKFNKNSGNVIRYLHNPNNALSIGANQIQNIFIEENSDIAYIGTFGGGLNKFNLNPSSETKFIRYKHKPNDPSSLSDDRVYYIFRDSEKKLWIATFGGGLNLFNEKSGRFTSYKNVPNDDNSLSNDRVISINEDSKGYLWIGTYGGGLNRFDKKSKTFKRYFSKDKVNSEVIYAAIEDNKNNLWISTNNGVFRLNLTTENIMQYDIEDGLQSKEFSGGAYLETDDGEIYFGGIKGLNYFHPDSIIENTNIPQIVISSVKIFNKPLQGEKENIELSHNENFITFEFSALDYSDPNSNHYKYMLEGFDKEWQNTTSDYRIAAYTNLEPGEYVFKVKGSNNDEVWNEAGTSLTIKINPPFWKTWWFVAFAVLMIGSIIYYVGTTRYKNQYAMEKLKTKLAADLHDSIGSGLTEISIMSELAANEMNNGASSQNLKNISETARQLVDNMSDIVWVVNPHRDSLSDLIIRLKDHYSDLLASLNISFKVSSVDDVSNIKLPMEYKQNLYLLLKESINNAIKHSSCKRIVLDVTIEESLLTIKLKDDGRGLDTKNIEYGNGIKNIKNRAKAIGGSVIILSELAQGTEIIFKGKVNRLNLVKTIITN